MALGTIGIWTNQLNGLTAPEFKDTVQEIESLGFGTLWQGEGATGREALTNAALTLSCTEHLVAATGIASIWGRDASAMLGAQRVLDDAFPSRFVLGLGVSHDAQVTARGHEVDASPLDAMRSYLELMDAQSSAVPTADGKSLRLLAALGPGMLELARRATHGAHPFLVTPEHTHRAREILGADKILAPEQGILLEEDVDTARSFLRAELELRLRLPFHRTSLLEQGFGEADLADGGSDALLDRLFAWGSIEDIARRVEEHVAAGADHVALFVVRPRAGLVPLAEWRELSALASS